MTKCEYCLKRLRFNYEQRRRIRKFMKKYTWVTQKDMAYVMEVSDSRISEILKEK